MNRKSASQAQGSPDAGRLFDELLVLRVWGGDRLAMERLAARWHPRLLRLASSVLGDSELARGTVQEAWMGVVRGIHSLKHADRFGAWASGIVRRKCYDAIGTRQALRSREIAPEEQAEGVDRSDPSEALSIRQAFATLPTDQRIAAHLYFVEGFTLSEIAEAKGVPLGTAKSRLFHARRKLKAALSDNPEGETP